ncbi:hypothetical protein DESC_140010 [Desulfosarcina cetonica]|nr:hypothetical protein DESC_140010 [Desulfosarcina cetonica]
MSTIKRWFLITFILSESDDWFNTIKSYLIGIQDVNQILQNSHLCIDAIHAFIKVHGNIDIAQRLYIAFRQSAEQVRKNYVFSFFQILAGRLDTIRNIFW